MSSQEKGAVLADRPNSNSNTDTTDTLPEIAPEITSNHQASRLVSKFGLAFETALVVASLAWGIAR
jgi:hypothetical protein